LGLLVWGDRDVTKVMQTALAALVIVAGAAGAQDAKPAAKAPDTYTMGEDGAATHKATGAKCPAKVGDLMLSQVLSFDKEKEKTHLGIECEYDLEVVPVESRKITAQPASPADGAVYVVPAGKTGAQWAGFAEGSLAFFRGGSWGSLAPKGESWAWVKDEGAFVHYTGGKWAPGAPSSAVATMSVSIRRTDDTSLVGPGDAGARWNNLLYSILGRYQALPAKIPAGLEGDAKSSLQSALFTAESNGVPVKLGVWRIENGTWQYTAQVTFAGVGDNTWKVAQDTRAALIAIKASAKQ
jgi:hypothetical protein